MRTEKFSLRVYPQIFYVHSHYDRPTEVIRVQLQTDILAVKNTFLLIENRHSLRLKRFT
jgi:hypothetical protein